MMNIKYYLTVILLSLFTNSFAKNYGIVNFSANYMREYPDYTSELGNQCLMGTVVEILEQKRYWIKIKSPEPYTGWVTDLGVTRISESEAKKYLKSKRYICISKYSEIFSEPCEESSLLSDFTLGNIIQCGIDESGNPVIENGFAKVMFPDGKTGYVPVKDVEDFQTMAQKASGNPDKIISTAKAMTGTPYLWGGASVKGTDCSGLVRLSFFMNGILLPRNASDQAKSGMAVDIGAPGKRKTENLKKGDLLFFGNPKTGKVTHVGIYTGDGKFIHSSQKVRINSLYPTKEDKYDGISKILCARRIIGEKVTNCVKDSPDYFLQ